MPNCTRPGARKLAALVSAITIALLATRVHADDVHVEEQSFTPPVQSFTAPMQTGKARRATVSRAGLYQAPADAQTLTCVGQALAVLDGGVFFVRAVDDFYEGETTIWNGALTFADGPGTIAPPMAQGRVREDQKYVAVCRVERDEDFQHNYLKGCAPNWYFGAASNIIGVRRNEAGERVPNAVQLGIVVPQPLPNERAELRIALNSDAPPGKENTLSVRLNGAGPILDLRWNGPGYRVIRRALESALLKDGENILEFVGDANYIKRLDWVEIETPARPALQDGALVLEAQADTAIGLPAARFAVDITDFGKESLATKADAGFRLLAGRRYYLAEAALPLTFGPEETLSPPVDAPVDYLAVAMRGSLPSLKPLMEQKQAHGLSTASVAFEDVLAVMNGGMYGPGAVQALIERARPKYVLIAGGFDRDCRRRQKNHREDPEWQRGIPAYMRQLEQLTVTDDPYTLDNTVKVGRVPLNDAQSLAAWAAKAVAFTPSDTLVLLSGTDKDYDFSNAQERHAAAGRAAVVKANGRPAEEVRQELFATMDAGVRLGIYQGHAQSWEIDKGLLDGSHAAAMPVSSWILATCNSGYYQADFEVYLRDWMRAPRGGCVNALASASIGSAGNQDQVIRQFLYFLGTQPGADWGGAMQHLKRNLPFNEKTMKDPELPPFVRKTIAEDRLTIDAFGLFGDPAARVLGESPRSAAFARNAGASLPLELTLSEGWPPALLASGALAVEWRPQRAGQWRSLALPGPLTPGANTITLNPEITGTDGGRFELQLVERRDALPPIVWGRTIYMLESKRPGAPAKVMLRQVKQGANNDAAAVPAVVLAARNEALVHRKHELETQFEIREKGKPGTILQQTEWLHEQRYRYETPLTAAQLEARARWRTKEETGVWSEWFGATAQDAPAKAAP